MGMGKRINESVERLDEEVLNEFMEKILNMIDSNGIGNKEKKKVNKIRKNLTKQIWSRFFLYKEKMLKQGKRNGFEVPIIDKKFIDGFMEVIKTEDKIKKDVYDEMGKELRALNKLYTGYRTKKISHDEMRERIQNSSVKPEVLIIDVINAIALGTTLEYMNDFLDMDEQDYPDGVMRAGIKSMRGVAKGFGGGIMQGLQARAKK